MMKKSENEVSYLIRGVVFDVYHKLGPGLFESVYEEILFYELQKIGLEVKRQVPLPIIWDDIKMEHGYRIDLLVENKVIVEIKSIENLAPVHFKQIATYLKLSNLKLGLLINFFVNDINKGITRYVNNL
jgi:GxxExxY protein